MQKPGFAFPPSVSPHQLFQQLRQAVEADQWGDVQQIAEALVHLLRGNQRLAAGAIRELIGVAQRRQCQPEVLATLARLPGFVLAE